MKLTKEDIRQLHFLISFVDKKTLLDKDIVSLKMWKDKLFKQGYLK